MPTLEQRLRARFRRVEGAVESDGVFGTSLAFWVNATEVAHFEGERAVDLRLTRKVISTHRERLKTDDRVELRRSGSDWILVEFSTVRDLDFVGELFEMAVAAHRPPPGVAAQPPPTGQDLERRRRFH